MCGCGIYIEGFNLGSQYACASVCLQDRRRLREWERGQRGFYTQHEQKSRDCHLLNHHINFVLTVQCSRVGHRRKVNREGLSQQGTGAEESRSLGLCS